MIKYLSILFFFICSYCDGNGQVLSGPETVKNYSVAQKRLLVINSGQFANLIMENNLDEDTIMMIACRITRMPFLLSYNEGFADKISDGTDFINLGKIAEALKLPGKSEGEKKIRLLFECGVLYSGCIKN